MPVRNLDEARACAAHLLRRGLRRVIVTLGANGALCASGEAQEHIRRTAWSGGYHRRGRCLHRQLRVFPGGRLCRSRGHRARQCLRGAIHIGDRHAESFVTAERFEAAWAASRGQKRTTDPPLGAKAAPQAGSICSILRRVFDEAKANRQIRRSAQRRRLRTDRSVRCCGVPHFKGTVTAGTF